MTNLKCACGSAECSLLNKNVFKTVNNYAIFCLLIKGDLPVAGVVDSRCNAMRVVG